MHILVAEDDRDIAELIALYARKAGWTPHITTSGDAALAHARGKPVDIAILDIMLPGISGLEVCRALRADPATAALPIIMVTARAEERDPVKHLIDIPRMADIAQRMLRDALDSYVKRDTGMARAVLNTDDELDALKTQVFRELLTYMLQDPSTIQPALDLILVSRHLERIGDHATNIAEDVIFMVAAQDVRHPSDRQRG